MVEDIVECGCGSYKNYCAPGTPHVEVYFSAFAHTLCPLERALSVPAISLRSPAGNYCKAFFITSHFIALHGDPGHTDTHTHRTIQPSIIIHPNRTSETMTFAPTSQPCPDASADACP